MTDAEIGRQQARDEYERVMRPAVKEYDDTRKKLEAEFFRTLSRATRTYLQALELADQEESA